MPKPYFDSLVSIRLEKETLKFFKHLGWAGVGLCFKSPQELSFLKEAEEIGIRVLPRLVYDRELLASLPISIKTQFAVSFFAEDRKDLLKGVRLREVRIISLKLTHLRVLDEEFINILRQHRDKFLELVVYPVMKLSHVDLSRVIAAMRAKEDLLYKAREQIILSSGAPSILDAYNPRQLKSFLRMVGFREDFVLKVLSDNPRRLFDLPNPVMVIELEGRSSLHKGV